MSPVISGIRPAWAVPGGRLVVSGDGLPLGPNGPPHVRVGEHDALVTAASSHALTLVVPTAASSGGILPIVVEGIGGPPPSVQVARELVTGMHQVDSPAFDGVGRLYVAHSGHRGTKVPVPIFRVGREGAREPVPVEIANPTSLALGPDGAIYVSSRFEGNVYRLMADDRVELFAAELGVPTGIAFSASGALFVGDRSGSILKILPDRQVETFASLPPSVVAFHLAFGPDGCLYVAAPTFASHDPIYRITPDRLVDVFCDGFGRPQGLAFDRQGDLYVADALAGGAGLYRIALGGTPTPELVVAAPTLVGVAFDPDGGIVLASGETVWSLDVELRPLGGPAA